MSFSLRFPAALVAILMFVFSAACQPPQAPPTETPTATPLPATDTPPAPAADPTSTDCPTAWTWATGPGSTDFDAALSQSLTDGGLLVRSVASSAFGENNQCNGSFHAMALDVIVELEVADTSHEERFTDLSTTVIDQVKEALPISGIPNLGRVEVRFIAPEATWRCVTASGSTECSAAP